MVFPLSLCHKTSSAHGGSKKICVRGLTAIWRYVNLTVLGQLIQLIHSTKEVLPVAMSLMFAAMVGLVVLIGIVILAAFLRK